MGLDQYIYKVTQQDFTSKEEVAYFRKANSLQGYFEEWNDKEYEFYYQSWY